VCARPDVPSAQVARRLVADLDRLGPSRRPPAVLALTPVRRGRLAGARMAAAVGLRLAGQVRDAPAVVGRWADGGLPVGTIAAARRGVAADLRALAGALWSAPEWGT
jgi:Flp pilus assembly CpaE family ATPase